MNKTIKLFVGGLPPTLTRKELNDTFGHLEPHMRIEMKMDHRTRLNKGFAFLLVRDPVIATKIVENEYMIRNRSIQVQYSKKVSKAKRSASMRLFCRGIPRQVTDRELTEFFDTISPCRAAYSIKDFGGKHKGFGFIELCTDEGAQALLKIRKFKFGKANLEVEEYNKPFRDREFSFQNKTSSIKKVDTSKMSLAGQHDQIAEDSQLLLKQQSSSVNVRTSRIEIWRFDSHPQPGQLDACLGNQREETFPGLREELLKIGPQNWIFRCPRKEMITGASRLDHQVENMRFNVLQAGAPMNQQQRR